MIVECCCGVCNSLINKFVYFSDVCNMVCDVYILLVLIVKKNGGFFENEVIDYVKKFSVKGRYLVDVWS